jgi:hypothetical protein
VLAGGGGGRQPSTLRGDRVGEDRAGHDEEEEADCENV